MRRGVASARGAAVVSLELHGAKPGRLGRHLGAPRCCLLPVVSIVNPQKGWRNHDFETNLVGILLFYFFGGVVMGGSHMKQWIVHIWRCCGLMAVDVGKTNGLRTNAACGKYTGPQHWDIRADSRRIRYHYITIRKPS